MKQLRTDSPFSIFHFSFFTRGERPRFVLFRVGSWIVLWQGRKTIHEITRTNTKSEQTRQWWRVKTLLLGVVSSLLVAAFISHGGRSFGSRAEEESIGERMRNFSQEIIAAYERRDTKTLKSFYAKQPDALFFWERKMTYTWDQIDRTMDGLVSAVANMKLTTTEFRSGGSGNTGWFAATFHAERTTREGKEFSSDGRWTVVAEKMGGKWLIVHEHTSFPLSEP